MATPYFDYFANFFENLRMDRPAYKAQAQFTHTAVGQAGLGPGFTQLLTALATAIGSFDENLTERGQSTAGTTSSYHTARQAWLAFVDDTMKDYVTPRLRKLPVYADFKKHGKSKLRALKQPTLVTESEELLKLYAAHQAALGYPTLVAEASQLLQAVKDADDKQDQQAANQDDARLALATDRLAIARAQRRLKAQLELTFDQPEKVYSFFDFSQSEAARKPKKNKDAATGSATAE